MLGGVQWTGENTVTDVPKTLDSVFVAGGHGKQQQPHAPGFSHAGSESFLSSNEATRYRRSLTCFLSFPSRRGRAAPIGGDCHAFLVHLLLQHQTLDVGVGCWCCVGIPFTSENNQRCCSRQGTKHLGLLKGFVWMGSLVGGRWGGEDARAVAMILFLNGTEVCMKIQHTIALARFPTKLCFVRGCGGILGMWMSAGCRANHQPWVGGKSFGTMIGPITRRDQLGVRNQGRPPIPVWCARSNSRRKTDRGSALRMC